LALAFGLQTLINATKSFEDLYGAAAVSDLPPDAQDMLLLCEKERRLMQAQKAE
jgi:hypothetical protein